MLIKMKLPERKTEIQGNNMMYMTPTDSGFNQALDEIESLNQPLVRGMEIDVEALAMEVHFVDGINSDPNRKQRAWDVCKQKERYIEMANHLKANAHVWLKEVEKGK